MGIFSEFDTQDLNRLAAKGILEKLRNIRQQINVEFTARRLIWELIQNAKDNAATCNINGNSKVKIEIELNPDQLIFRHDNGYFTNENIRGLIRRYSSSDKDRELDPSAPPPSTTGRFGTGFMTTHLLSEVIEVSGYFQVKDTLYKNFEVPIDRTGQTEKEIIQSIEKAFNVIEESINKSENCTISEAPKFKTQFKYRLDETGHELAKIAMKEFEESVAYMLICIPNIERVSVMQNGETHSYEINKIEEYHATNDEIEIIEVKSNNQNLTQKHFASIINKNTDTRIIIPIRYSVDKIEIKLLGKSIPRLFLDFPMIGTEDLNIPFIINNSLFEPTEPRDGVSLTGGNNKDTLRNSAILELAFHLYANFIDFAVTQENWDNLFYLAKIKKPKEKVWINNDWIINKIIKPIYAKLLVTTLVDTNSGKRISIKDTEGKDQVFFPSANNKVIRQKIWLLSNDLFPENLPKNEHIHEWYDIIWSDCFKQTIDELAKDVQGRKNIKTLANNLNKNEIETINWLNDFYDLVNLENKFINEIINDNFAVIPNQNGIFKKRSELFLDQGIDEELINVLAILNIDLRDKLRHKSVKTKSNYKTEYDGQILYTAKNQENVIDEINKIISQLKNENISKACDHLSSCFADDKKFPAEQNLIYNFCTAIWDMPEKKKLIKWDKTIWQEANKLQIRYIIKAIATDINVEKLNETLNIENGTTLEWLNSFVEFLTKNNYESQLNLKTAPILPNQNGIFCIKDNLFLDNGNIDESLKDIANELGYNVREELLAKEIFLELPDNRVRTQEQVAEEISKIIKPVLRDVNEREEKKDVIRKLYLWINKNKLISEEIFEEIYEKRFLLINDEEIIENIEKAEILDEIMKETGLSISEIKDKLKTLFPSQVSQIIPSGTVVLYPIGAEEDILLSPSLFDGSSAKSRISISEDAKEIIFRTLRDKGFNVPDNVSISYTIVTGIISPTGKTIKIVVKSAKAGKIYFNPSEWLALTEPDSQLFVVTRGNVVRNITLSDIEAINDIFHMRFKTHAFSMTNLKAFANFFKFQPYTHFIFETPESTTDYLKQFGLSERNPTTSELSIDDKNLLH